MVLYDPLVLNLIRYNITGKYYLYNDFVFLFLIEIVIFCRTKQNKNQKLTINQHYQLHYQNSHPFTTTIILLFA